MHIHFSLEIHFLFNAPTCHYTVCLNLLLVIPQIPKMSRTAPDQGFLFYCHDTNHNITGSGLVSDGETKA